jgi:hypothetical protein
MPGLSRKRALGTPSVTAEPKRKAKPKPKPAPIPVVVVVPVGRPRERRERRHVAKATSSADPGDEPPPPGDGARRLLRRLIQRGLSEDAWRAGAALVVALDEDATPDREAVAA